MKGKRMKIQEVMQHIKERKLPCVNESSDINEVVQVAVNFPHSRLVYVVDERKKLLGVITLGSLMRHLYPYHYEDKIHPRDILRRITVKKASDLMSNGNITASAEESVDVILKRMAKTGAKEIAVVDSEGRILADITVIDLLKYDGL